MEICTFLNQHSNKYPVHTCALSEALRITMSNNTFQFGDTYFKQLQGTAMCIPTAAICILGPGVRILAAAIRFLVAGIRVLAAEIRILVF